MDKLNLTKNITASKKVFFRKEMDESRLGEELYSEDVLSQYSVYLLRKFELSEDYEQPEQFEELLVDLPEQFNHEFEDCVVRNVYLRVTQKAVYITLFLALAHPLSKLQISDLRTWISGLEVSDLPLEHVSHFSNDASFDMARGLQETNGEVLLLTEMMNQFSENLNDIYQEVQAVKGKKTPPVVKVVQSKAAAKQAQEAENAQNIQTTNKKIEQLAESFSQFKIQIDEKLSNLPKAKKPPKFKIVIGTGVDAGPTVEERLEEALKNIDSLNKQITNSNQQIANLNEKIENSKPEKRPKLNFSIAKKVNQEQTLLANKLTTTNEEVTSIAEKLEQFDKKLNAVETNINEVKPDPAAIARIEKDRGQLQETVSETVKLTQVIDQLTLKLESVESELEKAKETKKKIPVVKLTKSKATQNLIEAHQKDQEQLRFNATEIKKLTQTVSKVDVQLIKAHQKIAELEQKMRQSAVPKKLEPVVAKETVAVTRSNYKMVEPQKAVVQPTAPPNLTITANRDFPTKETFLQASRPIRATKETEEERPTVTLAIEEMLDRVSEKHPQTVEDGKRTWAVEENYNQNEDMQGASLRRLKKLEWDIHSYFQKGRGLGHKGMISKDDFYTNIRQIEVLPYLWASVFERERKDILLGNELSCQQLIDDLKDFLEEISILSQKRKVMGKWIYCPKEVEQKMEGYKLLSEYLDIYLARQDRSEQ